MRNKLRPRARNSTDSRGCHHRIDSWVKVREVDSPEYTLASWCFRSRLDITLGGEQAPREVTVYANLPGV